MGVQDLPSYEPCRTTRRGQDCRAAQWIGPAHIRTVRRADLQTPIGPSQLSAVSVLNFSDRLSLSQLADSEQVIQPTMSRIVSSFVEARAVRKCSDPSEHVCN